jgi:hypothetical protein
MIFAQSSPGDRSKIATEDHVPEVPNVSEGETSA